MIEYHTIALNKPFPNFSGKFPTATEQFQGYRKIYDKETKKSEK